MKKIVLPLLLAVIFSGCLLQPQIIIKSAVVEDDFITVKLHSNKQVNVEVQLSGQSDEILCSKNATLNQGNTDVILECSASDSIIKVTVFADGAVFSGEVELSFDEGNLEERVIFLAETKTIEGEALKIIESNLAKQNSCNAQMYLTNMRKYYEVAGAYSGASSFDIDEMFDNITSEQMSVLDEQINATKTCTMEIGKKVADLGSGKYHVSFSWVGKGECYYADSGYGSRQFEGQKDVIVIEVNLKNNSAKAITGGMTDSHTNKEQAREMIKAFDLIGGCFKAMMLGVNPMAGIYQPPPSNMCSSPVGGNLGIVGFEVTPSYLVLQIKNNSGDSIVISDITASPVSIDDCIGCHIPLLESGGIQIVNLTGDFSGLEEVNEDIIISYTKNGLDHTEMANCRANIGTVIKEIKEKTEVEVIKINPADFNQSADFNITIG